MRTDERQTRFFLALSSASLILGVLGIFLSAWFAAPGLIAGAVPFSRLQKKGKSDPSRRRQEKLVVIFSVIGMAASLVTLLALAVNMTAALAR